MFTFVLSKTSAFIDANCARFPDSELKSLKSFASISMEDEKPFNFLRVLFGEFV